METLEIVMHTMVSLLNMSVGTSVRKSPKEFDEITIKCCRLKHKRLMEIAEVKLKICLTEDFVFTVKAKAAWRWS